MKKPEKSLELCSFCGQRLCEVYGHDLSLQELWSADSDLSEEVFLERVSTGRAVVRIGAICLSFASVNGGVKVIGRWRLGTDVYDAQTCGVPRERYLEAKRIATKAIWRERRKLAKTGGSKQLFLPLLRSVAVTGPVTTRSFFA